MVLRRWRTQVVIGGRRRYEVKPGKDCFILVIPHHSALAYIIRGRLFIVLAELYPAHFIRGFGDGDGGPNVYSANKFRAFITFVSTDERLLNLIEKLLPRYNIKLSVRISHPKRRIYSDARESLTTLYRSIHRFDDIKTYARYIGFGVFWKQEKLEDALYVIENYPPRERPRVWREELVHNRAVWTADVGKEGVVRRPL